MRVTKTFSAAIVALAAYTGTAAAEGGLLQLTAAEQKTVTDACRVGLPLIPVESDFGYETGEYALPLSGENGEVHSALIVSETALRDIPECRAEIDALANRDSESDNRIS